MNVSSQYHFHSSLILENLLKCLNKKKKNTFCHASIIRNSQKLPGYCKKII